jgi:hypothetical protein
MSYKRQSGSKKFHYVFAENWQKNGNLGFSSDTNITFIGDISNQAV